MTLIHPAGILIRKSFVLVAALAVLTLAGCDTLPGQGPSAMDVALLDDNGAMQVEDYTIVPMDASIAGTLGQLPPIAELSPTFSSTIKGKADAKLVVGDRLEINIWEASSDGLFSTVEKKQTQINATVDERGNIYVPYVETIPAAGRSVERVRKAIARGLTGKAVEPRVQVALMSTGGNKVSVVGDVAQPGQINIPLAGMRLIESIAQAGGSRHPGFESEVKIIRGSVAGTVRLDDVVRYERNNIWLKEGDTVEVQHRPRSFTAFGAVSSTNQLLFSTETLSFAEALAQSGGLNDNLADAGGVFLLRFEPRERLLEAGLDIIAPTDTGAVPTIYQLDFNQPTAFFVAGSFMMQDKDIIYVANAPAAEFRKFILTLIAPLFSSVTSAQNVGN